MVDQFEIDERIPQSSSRRRWVTHGVFILFLLILLCTHIIVFMQGNKIIDSDQPFLWQGTKDYSEGKFFEPRFYGQDYNTFMECLVATPLYKMGMPVYYALPLATHALFLCPILFTTLFLYRAGRRLNAILVLAVFLCMSTGFDLMTAMPRGFVTGIFFSTFFVLSCIHPKNLKYLLLNGAMLVLGIFVNPNVLIAAAPLLLYVWLHNYKRWKFYACALACALLFVPFYFMFDRFYTKHPDYVILNIVHSYKLDYFLQNISNLDQCFAHLSFFVEDNSIPLLVFFALLGVVIWRQDKVLLAAYIGFLLLLCLSFFIGKTREGTHWPLYSYSRMYLGVPFALCYCIAILRIQKDTLYFLAVSLTIIYSSYKLLMMERVIDYHTFHLRAKGVRIVPLGTVLDGMEVYKRACIQNDAERLVVSSIFWMSTYLTYGGAAVHPDFPQTEETAVDRRYWVREGQKDQICRRMVIISINYEFDKIVEGKYPFEVKRLDDYGLFLIHNNYLSNGEFLSILRDIED